MKFGEMRLSKLALLVLENRISVLSFESAAYEGEVIRSSGVGTLGYSPLVVREKGRLRMH